MFSLPKLQSLVAPFATPTGPAMFLGNEFYKAALQADVSWWLAIFVAVTTVVGVEFSGGLMCYCGVEAYQRNSRGKMWLAIIGAVVYAGIMFYGFTSLTQEKAHIFGIMVLLTLVAYLGYAIYSSFENQEKAQQVSMQQIKLETNKINAETRKIKASTSVTTNSTPVENVTTPKKTYICPYCNVDQGVAQRYSVHMRYCSKKEMTDAQ